MRHFNPTFSILLVLFLMATASPSTAQKLVRCSMSVDGQNHFQLDSIYPNQKVYLEIQDLGKGMRWPVMVRGSKVYLDGKEMTDIVVHERQTYVSADQVAATFGYDAKTSQGGLVVDLWTKAGAAGAPSVTLKIAKDDRLTSPNPNDEQLRLIVEIKNGSTQMLRTNARNFTVSDRKGTVYSCQGKFDIGVKPGESIRVDRLFFDVPKRSTLDRLTLTGPDGKEIGQAKF